MNVMTSHELTKFAQRELNDPDVFLIFYRLTGYYGMAKWVVKPPSPKASLQGFLSIGETPDCFTKPKVAEMRRRYRGTPIKRMKDANLSADKQLHRERTESDTEAALEREHMVRKARVNVAHPMWKPGPSFFAGFAAGIS